MSLSSQLLHSGFQEVLADVPAAPQPQIPHSQDNENPLAEVAFLSNTNNDSNYSTLPHPVTPEPNLSTAPDGTHITNPPLLSIGGLSSRVAMGSTGNMSFYSATGGGVTSGTDYYITADEATFSPRGSESDGERKSSWVWNPSVGAATGVDTGAFDRNLPELAKQSNQINTQSGMPEPLKPPTSGGPNDMIRQLGAAARNAVQLRMTNENSTNDDRIGYADIPTQLMPNDASAQLQPGRFPALFSTNLCDVCCGALCRVLGCKILSNACC